MIFSIETLEEKGLSLELTGNDFDMVFLSEIRKELEDSGYSLELIDSETVSVPNTSGSCSGFFDDNLKLIRVATRLPLDIWTGVLVHEFCHFRQIKESSPCTVGYVINGRAADEYIDAWFDKREEFSASELSHFFELVKALELDCERRSVELIEKYDLPIDVAYYIQMSNAYILSHNLMLKKREFVKQISKVPEVRNLPSLFLDDYSTTEYDHILELLF